METTALTFGQPLWLWALLLIPILTGVFVTADRRRSALLSKLIAVRLMPLLAGEVSRPLRAFRAVLLLLGLAGVIVALAQPQWGYRFHETTQKGRDVMIALDVSRSMLATDLNPTRLVRAKLMAQDLLTLLGGDRVGLIAFAGSAFVQAPLTLDHGAVLSTLDELDTTIIPKGGSNMAAAIRLAADAFGKAEGTQRALVIITDGEELEEEGVVAAKAAAKEGIRIFTVGVGSEEGSVIPIEGERGGMELVRDAQGNPVKTRLDAARLREIAAATGGFYTPLDHQAAQKIFTSGIEPMEMSEFGSTDSRQAIERYQWPLGFALACLILAFVLGERRIFHRNQSVLSMWWMVALISLTGLSSTWADGLEDYSAGNYESALASFQKGSSGLPEKEKLEFNAGAAAYQLGKYDDSVSYFTKALLTKDADLKQKASYNLGNALVRRGEAEQDGEKRLSDWKNALQHYEEALKIHPEDAQAKKNKETVEKLIEEEKKKQDQQKQDQQNKDQQNKDQQNKDQQNKDQQNKDQQNKDQQNKDQQKQDQQNQDQQNKDQQNKDQQNKDQQNQDQQNQDQQNQDQQNQDQQNKDQQNKDQQNKDQQNQDQQKQDQQNKDQQNQDQQNKDQQKQDQQNQDQQNQDRQPQPNGTPTPEPTPGEKKTGEIGSASDQQQKNDSEKEAMAGEQGEEEAKEGEMSPDQARALLKSLENEEEKVRMMQRSGSTDVTKDW